MTTTTQAQTTTVITQDMLVQVKLLRNQIKDMQEQNKRKTAIIVEALENGVPIENGLLRASLREGGRRPKWKEIVKKLKGEGYVNNVISHTKPGPPSLIVG